jgi:hypothetical protein
LASRRLPGGALPRDGSICAWALLLVLAFGGHLYTTDVLAQLDVAGSLVGARPFLTAGDGWLVEGADGSMYVPHGPGWSVLLVPAAASGLAAGPGAARVVAAATCAAASLLLVHSWRRLSRAAYGSLPGAGMTVSLGLCSMALVYGRMPYDVTAAAFLGTLALALSLEGREVAAGLAMGAALLVRLDCIVFLPSLVRSGRSLLKLAPGVALAALLIAGANWTRFGSPFEDGHSQDPAMAFTPGVAGMAGLLASPGKGLVWYAPAAVAALFAKPRIRLALPFLLALPLHGLLYDWTGGTGWGPRFLFPAIPALLAVLSLPGRRRILVGILTAWAVVCTAAAVWSDPAAVEQSLGADSFEEASRQEVIWSFERSPLFTSIGLIGRMPPDLFAAHVREAMPSAFPAVVAGQALLAGILAFQVFRRRGA